MQIRAATEQDLPAILAITNHAIEHTNASWQTVPTTLEARLQWWQERVAAGQPVLVSEIDGEIAGFATYGSFRAYGGYVLTVEHSIYVDGRFQGRGLGRTFLTALLDHATAAGLHVMVGAISADNAISIKLHEQFGFAVVGRMPEVGQKFGRWLDLVLMQKILD
ncbi:GNAT family N-acetyltransferase [Acidisoma silvae]|uniref:N-acetyltransferase n=1 Tax=Acidisoma silvae TaxID=2802396 RepID=A0A963YQC5_9PROT|nr:GNAT family N-acetyltransferase [Acidisoma silvae]MCB8875248.1 N-acetyltransferase [Acidisoma silvae]